MGRARWRRGAAVFLACEGIRPLRRSGTRSWTALARYQPEPLILSDGRIKSDAPRSRALAPGAASRRTQNGLARHGSLLPLSHSSHFPQTSQSGHHTISSGTSSCWLILLVLSQRLCFVCFYARAASSMFIQESSGENLNSSRRVDTRVFSGQP